MTFRMPLYWRMAVRPAAVPRHPLSSPSFNQIQHRGYASEGGKNSGEVKFWPFFAVIAIGTGGYMMLAKKRHNGEFPDMLA